MNSSLARRDRSPGFLPLFRDVIIIVALIVIGGPPQLHGLTLGSLLLATVGFLICGFLAGANRWRHLTYVAFGVWLVGVIKVLFMNVGVYEWLLHILPSALMMALGGAFPYVFQKRTRSQA